ncbi:MAG: hypothetical protein ABJD07_15705 [Gemmatimonadaceae bacterium]
MYTTCLFCHAPLPGNDVIESFPVGRRLAFDAAKGRLWVVCTACARWNLTPLEERWEAIEDCERRFRGTTLRVSTDNVGLARLPEGLELIRIGQPQRPELAAWRYGDQFGRRRRSMLLAVGAGLTTVGALAVGGVVLGSISASATWWGIQIAQTARSVRLNTRVLGSAVTTDGDAALVRGAHRHEARLVPGSDTTWSLQLAASNKRTAGAASDSMRFEGREAIRVASMLLARVNRFAGTSRQVADAARILDRETTPDRCYSSAARLASDDWIRLQHLPPAMRLALEMAAHEETERRALEGELAELDRAWKEAEEIAALADDLLLPANIAQLLAKMRDRRRLADD